MTFDINSDFQSAYIGSPHSGAEQGADFNQRSPSNAIESIDCEINRYVMEFFNTIPPAFCAEEKGMIDGLFNEELDQKMRNHSRSVPRADQQVAIPAIQVLPAPVSASGRGLKRSILAEESVGILDGELTKALKPANTPSVATNSAQLARRVRRRVRLNPRPPVEQPQPVNPRFAAWDSRFPKDVSNWGI